MEAMTAVRLRRLLVILVSPVVENLAQVASSACSGRQPTPCCRRQIPDPVLEYGLQLPNPNKIQICESDQSVRVTIFLRNKSILTAGWLSALKGDGMNGPTVNAGLDFRFATFH
jgi:hypothetical protein